jgi:pyruvate/2-oxoglutarate/acetoin dehydrogenase E1 component
MNMPVSHAAGARRMNFAQAINEAMHEAMRIDPKVICFGLGVDDPKRIFGTTQNLKENFGPERVFDMPTAENAMMGVGIGAALAGYRPVYVHQRLDFLLLAMDQLVNAAAKWHYMFGGRRSVSLVTRAIIGRGWGQGPTHSQALHAWFAHIPGLKVVLPTTPAEAKGLLLGSIFDNNPVLFLEHRWLHATEGEVPAGDYRLPLGKAEQMRSGNDLTIVSLSYMTVEALHVLDHLAAQGVSADLINLRTVRPIDWPAIMASVVRTGRLLVLDIGARSVSVASEIVARVSAEQWGKLRAAPIQIGMPDHAVPTSPALTKGFYPETGDIAQAIGRLLGRELEWQSLAARRTAPHDTPGSWFSGPF